MSNNWTALKVEVDQIISALFNLYSHRWPIEKGGVAYLVEMKRNTFAWTKGIWLFSFWSQIKKTRNSAFSVYKLYILYRWRNKCDQVLLWQLVLGLIGAVHNLSPSAVHNLRAKVAPSQKHICHYSVGAGEGAMLQSRICHDGGGEVLQYFHLLLRIFCLSSWRPNSLSKYPKISISRSAVLCSMINPVLDMVSYQLVDLVSSNSLE